MKKHSMSAKLVLATLVSAVALFGAAPAFAGTASADLQISANVTANCSISTSAVAFGSYDPLGTNASTPLDAQGSVSVQCTQGASATITLGQGANPGANSSDADPARQLASGADRLSYGLFRDAARTNNWGNTGGTGQAHTGTGAQASLTVYGRIPAGQSAPAGSFADTVTATVNF